MCPQFSFQYHLSLFWITKVSRGIVRDCTSYECLGLSSTPHIPSTILSMLAPTSSPSIGILSAKNIACTDRLLKTPTMEEIVLRILANLTNFSGDWSALQTLARPSCACSKSLRFPKSPWKSRRAFTQGNSSGVRLRVRREARQCLKVARVAGEQV